MSLSNYQKVKRAITRRRQVKQHQNLSNNSLKWFSVLLLLGIAITLFSPQNFVHGLYSMAEGVILMVALILMNKFRRPAYLFAGITIVLLLFLLESIGSEPVEELMQHIKVVRWGGRRSNFGIVKAFGFYFPFLYWSFKSIAAFVGAIATIRFYQLPSGG